MAKEKSGSPGNKTRFIASDGYLGTPSGKIEIVKVNLPMNQVVRITVDIDKLVNGIASEIKKELIRLNSRHKPNQLHVKAI